MLSVSNVSKTYAGRTLFSQVSFHINRGEKIGLIGPNGAGKSTLFSLLLRDTVPDDGQVVMERGISFGFLPQESAPIEDVTVLELATGHVEEHSRWEVEPKAKRILSGLAFGFPAVLLEAFNPVDALAVFNRHQATLVGGSTAFYVAYLGEQRKDPSTPILPSLRAMVGGGAAKPPNLHGEVRDEIGGRGIVHGYGMTEVPMIANGSPRDSDEQLANTDGKPVEGASVRIVTLGGQEAGPGEEGEIRVKGPMVFRGYTDPSLNAEAFDEDGWFRTGDLGVLRADGHLSITGRLKDVIVRKGENISAKEIENLLSSHPKVTEVAVIGLPDATRGELVCAVVQVTDPDDPLTFDEMVAFCRDAGLMTQKIPERLEHRTEWPRAGTGKIVKKELKAFYG